MRSVQVPLWAGLLYRLHSSPVLWLGTLLRWAEGNIQQWVGLWIGFPPLMKKENWIQVWSYLKPTHIPVSQAIQDHDWLCSGENQFCCHTLYSGVVGLCSFWVFWPAFLTWQYWELHSGVSQAATQLSCLGGGMPGYRTRRLFEDLHQAEPFPGQTAPPSWLHRWAKPLVGTATWVLQVGTQSVKIHVLVAVSLSLLLHHHQIPGGQALQISSPSLVGWVCNGGSQEAIRIWGKRYIYPRLSRPTGGSAALGVAPCQPGRSSMVGVEPLLLPCWRSLCWLSGLQGCSRLPHVLGLFSVVFCHMAGCQLLSL